MAIDIEETSSGDEAYHDDPIESQPKFSRFRKSQSILASFLILIFGTFFIQSTLAGNININSGSGIEFGQGLTRFAACSGATPLTLTPRASFLNQAGAGSFYFSSFTISNIPAACSGSSFTLTAYGTSSSTPLAIFDTTTTNAVVNDSSGSYSSGSGSSLIITSDTTTAFTATFSNPVSLGSSVIKLALQSSTSTTAPYNSIQFTPTTYMTMSPGLTLGNGAFTIETWLKTASTIHGGDIIGNYDSGSLSFILDNANLIHTDGYNVTAFSYATATPLQPNTWYHIAMARNASKVETVWVNGVRSSTGVQTDYINYSTPSTGINWAICTWCVEGGSKFNGERMSNLRVVIGRTLYDPNSATITVPTMPLANIADTKLLLLFNDAGSITVDSSGNQTLTNYGTTFVTGQ